MEAGEPRTLFFAGLELTSALLPKRGRHGDGKIVMMMGLGGPHGATQDFNLMIMNQILAGILVEGIQFPPPERSAEEEEAAQKEEEERWANRSDSEEEKDFGPRWRMIREKKQKKKKARV